jgi:defect-in-organelle-trafficking protein DotC
MAKRRTHCRRRVLALVVIAFVHVNSPAWSGEGAFETPREVTPVRGTQPSADLETLTLAIIQGWSASDRKDRSTSDLGELRRRLLQETAQQVAASAALAAKSFMINQVFEKYGRQFDQVYRFDQLTLHNGLVLPAVIKEANDMAALEDGTLRRVLRAYRIAQAEVLLTRAPNWRQWLLQIYPYPEKPLDQLLPRNREERRVWREAAAEGWGQGIEQAHEVAKIRLAKMQQAFVGMIRFHLLKACRMVTEPKLKKTRRGVSNQGNELLIGEELYRITRTTRFRKGRWEIYPEIPSLFDAMSGVESAGE